VPLHCPCSALLGGQSGLLLRLLLSSLTKRTAGALGVKGGGEFLAARRAAEEVEAQVCSSPRSICEHQTSSSTCKEEPVL